MCIVDYSNVEKQFFSSLFTTFISMFGYDFKIKYADYCLTKSQCCVVYLHLCYVVRKIHSLNNEICVHRVGGLVKSAMLTVYYFLSCRR